MKKIVIFGSTGNIGAYFTDYCNNMIDKKHSFIGVKARDIPKIIKFKATTSLRISCLFCIFKHSPKKRFDGQNGGNLK